MYKLQKPKGNLFSTKHKVTIRAASDFGRFRFPNYTSV